LSRGLYCCVDRLSSRREGRVKTEELCVKSESRIRPRHSQVTPCGVRSARVVTMIERTLMLTWRKALLMAAVFAGLLFGHIAVNAICRIDEAVLFLGAALVVPMWAISAAVYTLDSLLTAGGRGRRHLV
jgi:hypothetical protein